MTEFINNEIFENFNFRKLNDILNKREDLNEYERKKFFFLLSILIFLIFIIIIMVVLLIKKRIRKKLEKMRRVKLQKEINKIMMIDIFETRSPSLDIKRNEFHSINNDSSLGEISSHGNFLSEINIQNDIHNSKGNNDI